MHGPVRARIAGISQAVCLSGCLDSFAFRTNCEDVSSEALVSAPQGGPPRDGEPKERSRGTQAEGRKCHRVSFASKGREKRGTSREEEEGEARIQAEGRVRKKLR